MFRQVREFAKKNIWLRKFIGYYLASSGLFDIYLKKYPLSDSWKLRLKTVMSSPDNAFIPRDKNAGIIHNGKQYMHNSLKIHLGSYYGPEYARMLELNKGVHEPQEERVFLEALSTIPNGATMIEMGAFWSFYSMWFQSKVPEAKNFMIEPDLFNIGHGKRNFKLNKMKGVFLQAFVGKSSSIGKINTVCVDDFLLKNKIFFVDMLHSDIQGFEYEMLLGAKESFNNNKIGYIFISTHSNEIHYQCLAFLQNHKFIIIASADIDQTYSEDGLIAARAPFYKGTSQVKISLREKESN